MKIWLNTQTNVDVLQYVYLFIYLFIDPWISLYMYLYFKLCNFSLYDGFTIKSCSDLTE